MKTDSGALGRRALFTICALCTVVSLAGCGAGSTKVWATSFSKPPEGVKLKPGPPEDVYWIRIASAKLPAKTNGGQSWDDDAGLPDPYIRIRGGKKEQFRSRALSDQLLPVWGAKEGFNIRIPVDGSLTIAVMDSDSIDDAVVGESSFEPPTAEELTEGTMTVSFGRGTWLKLDVARAHAIYGLGLDYAVTRDVLQITRVMKHSPAGRKGLKAGDRIVQLDGKQPSAMGRMAIRTTFRTIPSSGLSLIAQRGDDARSVTLKEGPIYPLHSEYGLLP